MPDLRDCPHCHHSLTEDASFCSQCGAPQLRVQAPDIEQDAASAQPRVSADRDIVWPIAVRVAALYAVPTAILFSFLSVPFLDQLWVIAGAIWTVREYRKKAHLGSPLSKSSGGRIGMLLGLFAAVFSTLCVAVYLLLNRYLLHFGVGLDEQYRSDLANAKQFFATSNPDSAVQLEAVMHTLLSPEGIGMHVLLSTAMSASAILFFGWLGGRFGVRQQLAQRAHS